MRSATAIALLCVGVALAAGLSEAIINVKAKADGYGAVPSDLGIPSWTVAC